MAWQGRGKLEMKLIMERETKKQIISRYGKVISKLYRAINNNSYSIGGE